MDARLYGRIDASDVLRHGFVDVAKAVESSHLNRFETAVVLGILEEAGAKRYIRVLKKLKAFLAAMRGGMEGF
jgi:hypothetical protein